MQTKLFCEASSLLGYIKINDYEYHDNDTYFFRCHERWMTFKTAFGKQVTAATRKILTRLALSSLTKNWLSPTTLKLSFIFHKIAPPLILIYYLVIFSCRVNNFDDGKRLFRCEDFVIITMIHRCGSYRLLWCHNWVIELFLLLWWWKLTQ